MISAATTATTQAPGVSTIADCTEKLERLFDRINMPIEGEATNGRAGAAREAAGASTPAAVSFDDARPTDDAAILAKASELPTGDSFVRLWAGDLGEVGGDPSTGDYKLCGMLAYLVGNDPGRIEQLFNQSALAERGKWKEREQYRTDTIAKALKNRRKFFDWSKPSKRKAQSQAAVDEVFGNSVAVDTEDGGKASRPLALKQITELLREATATPEDPLGLPRRVRKRLFVPNYSGGVDYLTSPSALFGWAKNRFGVFAWRKGDAYTSQPELFAELCRTAPAYEAVETIPHCPPMPGTFYAWTPTKGDGSALAGLLTRLSPETDHDFELIRAFFATLIWGGASGLRPAFVITSDAGRGAGKTTLIKLAGLLVDGLMTVSQSESAAQIATRLLSKEGLGCRLVLIDNVKSRNLSWAELEALITSPVISGHEMYEGEGRRPNTLVWTITLNGASLSKDLAQRCVIIKLAAPTRCPLWEESTTRYVVENRAAIIGDLLAFFDIDPEAIARPSRWATWEREVLARLPDSADLQKTIVGRQIEADVEADECGEIEDHFRERLAALSYDPANDRVHIPSRVAAEWFREATGESKSPTAVTRIVRQLNNERVLKFLSVDPSRTNGRGLLWSANVEAEVRTDLPDRMERDRLRRIEDESEARRRGATR